MVRIRLTRVGAKGQPHYRVVVADQRSPRDGRFIEIIGNYNPRIDPPAMAIDQVRALYWLRRGALPSDAVQRLLNATGVSDILAGKAPEPAAAAAPGAGVAEAGVAEAPAAQTEG